MSFAELIEKEKDDSLDNDYKVAGRDLMPALEKRGRKLVQSVADQLDKKKPNDEQILTDERQRIKQATRNVNFEKQLHGIINTFASNILPIRDRYYRETMRDLVGVWEQSVNPLFLEFGGIVINFTKEEIRTLARVIFGTDINEIMRKLRDRTIARFRAIVLESYRSSRDKGAETKSVYKAELQGAMNAMIRSMNNIIKGFTQVIWEQAYSRFLTVVNGG